MLYPLTLGSAFVVFIGWWAVLFTGQFPRGLHRFVVGVMRWWARVAAYMTSLTDVFPPFSLDEDAGPGGQSSLALSAVIGAVVLLAAVGGGTAAGVFAFRFSHKAKTVDISYQSALAGKLSATDKTIRLDNVEFTLMSGSDPTSVDVVKARPGYRLVEFTLLYRNDEKFPRARGSNDVETDAVRLETSGGVQRPVLLTVDGVAAPAKDLRGRTVPLRAIFEVANGDDIEQLRGYPRSNSSRHVAWRFR